MDAATRRRAAYLRRVSGCVRWILAEQRAGHWNENTRAHQYQNRNALEDRVESDQRFGRHDPSAGQQEPEHFAQREVAAVAFCHVLQQIDQEESHRYQQHAQRVVAPRQAEARWSRRPAQKSGSTPVCSTLPKASPARSLRRSADKRDKASTPADRSAAPGFPGMGSLIRDTELPGRPSSSTRAANGSPSSPPSDGTPRCSWRRNYSSPQSTDKPAAGFGRSPAARQASPSRPSPALVRLRDTSGAAPAPQTKAQGMASGSWRPRTSSPMPYIGGRHRTRRQGRPRPTSRLRCCRGSLFLLRSPAEQPRGEDRRSDIPAIAAELPHSSP